MSAQDPRTLRITSQQRQTLKALALRCFGSDAQIWLFGSRADPGRHGGDIDLYVEVPGMTPDQALDAKLHFLVLAKQQLGDRRIDVVLNTAAPEFPLPIHRVARTTGVPL